MIDALRPDVDSPAAIRAALKASGLHRDVCSPRIGGGSRGSRTKLTVINEARALFVLPPLADIDPASVARHQAQYLARQVPMGAAVPSPTAAPPPTAEPPPETSSDEDAPLSTDDEGEEAASSRAVPPDTGAAVHAPVVAATDEAVSEPLMDVSGITVGAIFFEWPTRGKDLGSGP